MVKKMSAKNKAFWDSILYGEKILSDEEAEEFMESIAWIRKEHGYRDRFLKD